MGNRTASGVITNYHLSTPSNKWYTTQEIDEVIIFKDKDNNNRSINNWSIFANTTDLEIQLIKTFENEIVYESDVITIESNTYWSNDYIEIEGIKILGEIGQQVRYVGNFF